MLILNVTLYIISLHVEHRVRVVYELFCTHCVNVSESVEGVRQGARLTPWFIMYKYYKNTKHQINVVLYKTKTLLFSYFSIDEEKLAPSWNQLVSTKYLSIGYKKVDVQRSAIL